MTMELVPLSCLITLAMQLGYDRGMLISFYGRLTKYFTRKQSTYVTTVVYESSFVTLESRIDNIVINPKKV